MNLLTVSVMGNLSVAVRLVVNLTIAAVRLVNASVRVVMIPLAIAVLNLTIASVRLVNLLLVRSVNLLLVRSVNLTAVRSVDALSLLALGRHTLSAGLAAAGAAARLPARFSAAAGGVRLMRVVSVETTFIEAAALGSVLIKTAVRVGSVGILNLVDNVDGLDRLKFV